jgi:hypothetical protein
VSKAAPVLSTLVQPSLDAIDALGGGPHAIDTLVLCMTSDTRPLPGAAGFADWRLCGRLSRLIVSGVVTGAPDEKVLMSSEGLLPMTRVLLYGFGKGSAIMDDGRARLTRLGRVLDDLKAQSIAIDLPPPGSPMLPLVDECLRGLLGDRLRVVFAPESEPPRVV